jgi:hypothetical protein
MMPTDTRTQSRSRGVHAGARQSNEWGRGLLATCSWEMSKGGTAYRTIPSAYLEQQPLHGASARHGHCCPSQGRSQ